MAFILNIGVLAGCNTAGLTCSGDWERETVKELAYKSLIDQFTGGTLEEGELQKAWQDAGKDYKFSLEAIRTLSEKETYVECVTNLEMDAISDEARTGSYRVFYTVYLTDNSDIYLEIDGLEPR